MPYLAQAGIRILANIAENLAVVRERIALSAGKSGRNAEDVTLVVVTKTIDVPRILEAIAAGATDIGENYIQEADEKWQEIGSKARWHFIGHLQTNKAKQAVRIFSLIQSVDSLHLAQEIGKRALALGKTIDVLMEVKISGEETKFGASPDDVLRLTEDIASVDGVRLQGLMGMAPFVADPEEARPYFARLRAIWEKLPNEQRQWLSMGMSHDFDIAIEEGSNMVRIGTAIFGPRS